MSLLAVNLRGIISSDPLLGACSSSLQADEVFAGSRITTKIKQTPTLSQLANRVDNYPIGCGTIAIWVYRKELNSKAQ